MEQEEVQEQQIDTREKQLLEAYVMARKKKDELERLSGAAGTELEKAKNELVDYLMDAGKKSTGRYDNLGSVLVTEPIPSIKIKEGFRDEQMKFVREIGAGACIKEQIHHATFASLIRERIEKGEGTPDFVEIFYIPQVKYLKPNEKPE